MGAVGAITVLLCVFGAYVVHGGHLQVVWQPSEMVIIFGAALGGMIIANPMHIVKMAFSKAAHAWFGKGVSKKEYLELLTMMFQVFQIFRKEGPQSVEKHIEEPEKSDIFKNYPSFQKNHHAVEFFCDTIRITLAGDISPYDLDDLMNDDIKTIHEEEHMAQHAIGNIGEGLPGLGIVAAVLGVVHTMGLLDQGTQVIGHSVGAALVGTFLGVLMCYGFVSPTATKMANDINAEGRYLLVMKAALVALQRGAPPLVCVEYARRTIYPADRPTFAEVEAASKGAPAKAA
jgi:chemotaxis protein MotA